MSDRERLHEIIDHLHPAQVSALLTLLEPGDAVEDPVAAAFANTPEEEETGKETIAEVLAAQAEPGPWITHDGLKHRHGLE